MPALASDLGGLGLPMEQAIRVGYSALTTIAGTGTAQVGGAAIPNFTNNVSATAVAGQTALVLPASAELEVPYMVFNAIASTASALVYPPTGGQINGAAVNAVAPAFAAGLARVFIRKTATAWVSFLTA